MIPGIHDHWSFKRGDLHPLTLSVRYWATSPKDLLELSAGYPDRMDYKSSQQVHGCHDGAGLNADQAIELGWLASRDFDGDCVIHCKHSNGHHDAALVVSRESSRLCIGIVNGSNARDKEPFVLGNRILKLTVVRQERLAALCFLFAGIKKCGVRKVREVREDYVINCSDEKYDD